MDSMECSICGAKARCFSCQGQKKVTNAYTPGVTEHFDWTEYTNDYLVAKVRGGSISVHRAISFAREQGRFAMRDQMRQQFRELQAQLAKERTKTLDQTMPWWIYLFAWNWRVIIVLILVLVTMLWLGLKYL